MKLNRKISLLTGLFNTALILLISLAIVFQWFSTLRRLARWRDWGRVCRRPLVHTWNNCWQGRDRQTRVTVREKEKQEKVEE